MQRTDGDKYFITNIPVIVNALVGGGSLPMVYDKGKKADAIENTRANRIAHFVRCAKKAQIGVITNYATVWTDIALHNKSRSGACDTNVAILRVLQGRDIDSVKTGDVVTIPENLKTNYMPHWTQAIVVNTEVKVKAIKKLTKKSVVYTSVSAIGQLYNFIINYYANFILSVQDNNISDRTMKFATNINHNLATKLTPVVQKLEQEYRSELNAVTQLELKNLIDSDSADESRKEIFDRYTQLMKNLSDDQATVASIAYNICYNRTNNSARESLSFVWVTCFNGLLQLLHMNGKNYRLVKVPTNILDGEEVNKVTVNSGLMAVNDMVYAQVNITDGIYQVHDLDGEKFIKVASSCFEYKDSKENERSYVGENIVSFSIAGFKYLNLNVQTVADMINSAKELTVAQEGNSLSVLVNGNKVGVVIAEDRILAGAVINKACQVKGVGRTEEYSAKQGKVVARGKLQVTVVPVSDVEPIAVAPAAEEETVYDDTMSVTEVHALAEEYGYIDDFASYDESYTETVVEAIDEPIVMVSTEEVLKSELKLDAEVMKRVNQNAIYWTNPSLEKPKGIADYSVIVINMNAKHGETVGQIVATATNGNVKSFDVFRDEKKGITINEDLREDFKYWALRVMSYEHAYRRTYNK